MNPMVQPILSLPCPSVSFELHRAAHRKYMDEGIGLDGTTFTMDDRRGLEEAIIAAYLGLTELEGGAQ